MHICKLCKGEVEEVRVQMLKSMVCSKCAHNVKQSKVKGIMVFNHKTGGSVQVVNEEAFQDYRRLAPYGRNTGRGSGLHRVTKTTSAM